MLKFDATLRTFFDRKVVIDAVDKAERKVLSKVGAFTMRTDRKSIKEKKGSAPPGKPPHAHDTYYGRPKKGKASKRSPKKRLRFRDSILFSYDAGRKSVVIGAYLFNTRSRPTVPEVLEHGGRSGGRMHREHPHTGPAFKKELRDSLPRILKDCVTR
jgi:hypothetical protein